MKHLILLAALGVAAPAWADDPQAGAASFRAYCATCHGLDAVGDGPMTAILAIRPPDLTRLARNADGVFPMGYVVRRIDGRDALLSHGGTMPVFGFLLAGPSGVIEDADGSPILTPQSVVDLALWLRMIQR